MLSVNIQWQVSNFAFSCKHQINLQGITGILGHSGSGKTTLLRAIAGLNKHVQGQISFAQKTLLDSANNTFIAPEDRNIGFVFQDARLFPHLNVYDNLLFAYKRSKNKRISIDESIALTKIQHLTTQHVEQLSAGQKQRVAIARALLSDPTLLLLDEPLSALDGAARGDMVVMLRKIHQQLNLPMLYVSHSVNEIQQLADEVMVMAQGKVIQTGFVHQIINNLSPTLVDQYSNQTSLTLEVVEQLPEYGLTRLDFPKPNNGQITLFTNQPCKTTASSLRCYILANDISLTKHPHQDTSMVNNLEGHITSLEQLNANTIQVLIDVLGQEFKVNITRYSEQKLQLAPGQPICLQFKANAIRYFS